MGEKLNDGHRKRAREEFLNIDEKALPDYKILELLLFYGIPRRDTKDIAKTLINRFGSLAKVLEADVDDLRTVKGMTDNAACLIKVMLPIIRRYIESKNTVRGSLRSYDEMGSFVQSQYITVKGEKAILLCLDRTGKVLATETLSEGDFDSAGVSIRTIVEHILRTGATAVVLAHNHPSGIALPSPSDIVMTRKVYDALNAISVNLVDHIIVAGNDHVSMAQSHEFDDIFH